MRTLEESGSGNGPGEESSVEVQVSVLRQRWELASILNFLTVFKPVIGGDLKLSVEEIERGLVNPNSFLAKLHVMLLKGIPPVCKTLNDSDAWVTALCRKLAMWWPWVAEGDIPLKASKGEEISGYKELEPTKRLLLLKALCEVRANQDDIVSYVKESLKDGTEVSSFCKYALGGDGAGTTYWYDGSAMGHRLYREIITLESNAKTKAKGRSLLPTVKFQWETLATNLEEFRRVVDKLLSSKVAGEVAVGKVVGAEVIPVLEKLEKKEERALKRKERQEMRFRGFKNSKTVGTTRSCRNHRPINYTFDEYDRIMKEAIKLTNKGNATEDQRQRMQSEEERSVMAADEPPNTDMDPEEESNTKADSIHSDTKSYSGR